MITKPSIFISALSWVFLFFSAQCQSSDSPASVDDLRSRLFELSQRYTDNHPEIIHLKKEIARAKKTQNKAEKTTGRTPPTVNQKAFDYYRSRKDTASRKQPGKGPPTSKALIPPDKPFTHPGGIHTAAQLTLARRMIAAGIEPYRSAFASLFSIALKETATPPRAVATFDVPAFFKDPLGHQKVASLLANDARAAYVCGIIYQTAPKADRKSAVLCANQAVRILDHWAERNVRIAGADGNLVMTYAGIGLIFAAELLDDYEGWSGLQRERFRRWVTKVYLPAARSKSRFYNNHGDWGMLGRIASHHLLDNGRAVAEDIELIKQRIDKNIARNGHMPAEIRRKERGIWYTYFALAPMTSAAEIAYNATGIDLFQYTGRDGAGLRAALDYLFRYSRNPSSWPHFDKKSELMMPTRDGWPNNLFEAMYGVYRSDEYNRSLSPVRPITFMRGHFAWAAPTLLRPMR